MPITPLPHDEYMEALIASFHTAFRKNSYGLSGSELWHELPLDTLNSANKDKSNPSLARMFFPLENHTFVQFSFLNPEDCVFQDKGPYLFDVYTRTPHGVQKILGYKNISPNGWTLGDSKSVVLPSVVKTYLRSLFAHSGIDAAQSVAQAGALIDQLICSFNDDPKLRITHTERYAQYICDGLTAPYTLNPRHAEERPLVRPKFGH